MVGKNWQNLNRGKSAKAVKVAALIGLIAGLASCAQLSTTKKRKNLRSKSTNSTTVQQPQKQSEMRVFKPEETGTMDLGDDLKVRVPEGVANENIRVSIRRAPSVSIEEITAITVESALSDAIEIEVVSDVTGELLPREALKKALVIIKSIETDKDKDAIRPAVTAPRANGADQTYFVEKSDVVVTEGAQLQFGLNLLESMRNLTFEFAVWETKASATLFLVGTTNSGTGTGAGSGTVGSTVSSDPIWRGNHASGLSIGSTVEGSNMLFDLSPSGEDSSTLLDSAFDSGGYFYVLSRTEFASANVTKGGIRRFNGDGSIDASFSLRNSFAGLNPDTPTAMLLTTAQHYIAAVDLNSNNAVITGLAPSDGTITGFGRQVYPYCNAVQDAGDCQITTIVDCDTAYICVFGRTSYLSSANTSFFYASYRKSDGAILNHTEMATTANSTMDAGIGVLHSNGYLYGITSQRQSVSSNEYHLSMIRGIAGAWDSPFGKHDFPDDSTIVESNIPIKAVEDSGGNLLLLANSGSAGKVLKVDAAGNVYNHVNFRGSLGTHGLRLSPDTNAFAIAALPNERFAVAYSYFNIPQKRFISVFEANGNPANIFLVNASSTNTLTYDAPTASYYLNITSMKYIGGGILAVAGVEAILSDPSITHIVSWKIAVH